MAGQSGAGDRTRVPPGLFAVLMGGSIAQGLIFMVVAPLLPRIVAPYGDQGTTIAQFIYALPSLGRVLIGLIGGWLIDRYGARPMVVAALLAYAVLGLVPMVANDLVTLLTSRLLLGIVAGLAGIALTVTVVGLYAGQTRSAMLGFQGSVGSFAALTGSVASGAIAAWFGWRYAFLLYALPMVPLALIAWRVMPHGRPAPADGSAGLLSAVRLFWPIYLAAAAVFLATTMFGGLTPFLLIERGVRDPLVTSLVLAMVTFGGAVGGALFGKVYGRLGERGTMMAGLGCFGAGALALGAAPDAWTAGAASLVGGLGIGTLFPWLSTRLAATASEAMRARGFAVFGMAMYLGGFAYPIVATPLIGLAGRAGAFTTMGLLTLAAAVVFAWVSGRARATA